CPCSPLIKSHSRYSYKSFYMVSRMEPSISSHCRGRGRTEDYFSMSDTVRVTFAITLVAKVLTVTLLLAGLLAFPCRAGLPAPGGAVALEESGILKDRGSQ